MKKYMGNYTAEAAKALKNAERLFCRIDDDGTIYVTNGFIACKMNPLEYAAIVQSVACLEAGNWSMRNGEKTEEPPFDLVNTFREAVKAAEAAAALGRCPLALNTGKTGTASAYYNADKGFTALYNAKYIAALFPGFTLHTPGANAPAVAYRDNEPFALILPIRCDDKTARTVKAYFTQPDDNTGEAESLRAELAQAQHEIAALRAQIAQQAADLDALREAQQAQDNSPQPANLEPKTAAELIAARFSDLAGVTVTIKGAQTSAPVVWLTGDTEKHADEISAAGAKWSNKKSAFYVRVA